MIRRTIGALALSIVAGLVLVLGGAIHAQQRGGDGMQGGTSPRGPGGVEYVFETR